MSSIQEPTCGHTITDFSGCDECRRFVIDANESIGYQNALSAVLALPELQDELSNARPDKLRQSPPWQRNQLRASIRAAIQEMMK